LLAEGQLLAHVHRARATARAAARTALVLLLSEPTADRVDALRARRRTPAARRALGDLDPRRQRDHAADSRTRRTAGRLGFLDLRLDTSGIRTRTLGAASASALELHLEAAACSTGDLLDGARTGGDRLGRLGRRTHGR